MDPYAWSADVETLVLTPVGVAAYALALRRYPAPRWRVACFALGVALAVAAFVTPLETIALHYLLTAHLLQNVVLAEWAPALCLLGLSPALARALAGVPGARTLTHPLVALPLWLGVYFAWHVPLAYDTALEHQSSLLHLEHGTYFVAGALFWWPVIHGSPRRLGTGAKAAYVFIAFVLASPLGLLLALLPTAIYSFYRDGPGLWGLGPLADQQIAGITMASEQAVVLFFVFAPLFLRFLREEESAGIYSSLGSSSASSRARRLRSGP